MESQSQMNNIGDNSRLNDGVFGSDGHGGGSHDGNRGGNHRDDGPGFGDVYGDINTGGSCDDGAGVGDVHGDVNPGGSRKDGPDLDRLSTLMKATYKMLNDESSGLRWNENGTRIVVESMDEVSGYLSKNTDMLFVSFDRSLLKHGFKRFPNIKSLRKTDKKEYEHPDFVKDHPERFEFIKPRPRTTTRTAVLPHTPHPSNTNTNTPHPSNTNTNTGNPLPSNTGTPHRLQEYELILHDMVNLHREVSEIGRVVSKIDGNVSAKLETLISFLSGGNPPAPQGSQAEWHRIPVQSASEGATRPPKRQCRRNSTEHVANDPIQAVDNELGMGVCNLNTEDMLPPLFGNDQG